MAQAILGGVGGAFGGEIGRAVGAALGGMADRALINGLSPARQVGPRLEGLKLQSSADGAPMACVLGRARVAGQVIWAARFRESRNTQGGGKSGSRTVEYAYSLSFAVALCEGPIDGVGRVWADGRPMDLTQVVMRVHRGGPDQAPDPLIEAVEGITPAFRGVAYALFEDLPLAPYGNRPPQLSFEVLRGVGEGLENRLEGVCLIPGAGEFVLATEPVFRRDGLTRARVENVHQVEGRSNLEASLDQLDMRFPGLKRVNLVVGWFGDDLRAGHCRIRPGVESRERVTEPVVWSVAGLDREGAHLVSGHDGAPAYGGTPSDESVRQAVAAIRARGWKAILYPFVFMDIPAGNGLPDPYGGAEQAAYPWRGRIRGQDGAEAEADIAALFGGDDDAGLRRMALHYAGLVAETGAHGLLIGSEMRGVTWTRDAAGGYPAVTQYCALAEACRAVVGPDVELAYAADWSEYAGHRPEDGSGDVRFHLDPLWSHPAISHVAIDWYPPMGDWREGDGGLDGEGWKGPDDPGYLAAQVAGGEGFDWFYADEADRAAQRRTAIADTACGEDWVFRVKDLVGWWSNAHHDRIGGVRQAGPGGWTPGMKPIRLTEFGCAAVNRGGNAPNLFLDPKSAESALPPHSSGARDDGMQRRLLEAVLDHFARPENNPASAVYGGPMLAGAEAWCWDARPWPAFPAMGEVWRDAAAWRCGHWLNGRAGTEGGAMLAALLRRAGLEDGAFSIGGAAGLVSGYVVDRPMRTRDAIQPLLGALGLTGTERGGRLDFSADAGPGPALAVEALALDEARAPLARTRTLEPGPDMVRVRFIDETADYRTGSVVVRSDAVPGATGGGGLDLDLPAVCDASLALEYAQARLAEGASVERLTARPGPLDVLRREVGDVFPVEGYPGLWRLEELAEEEAVVATLAPVVESERFDLIPDWRTPSPSVVPARPWLAVLDLPPLFDGGEDERPHVAVAADPWAPMQIWAGASLVPAAARGQATRPAAVGRVAEAVPAGPAGRWDRVNTLLVDLEGEAPASLSAEAVLDGGNAIAVETGPGSGPGTGSGTGQGWEIVQFRRADAAPGGLWRLSGLLRGQRGTEVEAAAGIAAGATVVVLDDALARPDFRQAEAGLPLIWRAGPAAGSAAAETAFTWRGVRHRPFRPARLRLLTEAGGGLTAIWTGRSSADLDGWGGADEAAPARFRVRLLQGEAVRLEREVEGTTIVFPADDLAAAFPGGPGAWARVAVARFGDRWGWGPEAVVQLES